jgi:hypothetical protein
MAWLQIIQSAVSQLDQFLKTTSWHGRENEVVNLFAHRFLAQQISATGPLRSLRQVGIEVAVRQVTGSGKQYVRKDLVIWPVEDMTAWIGNGTPSVILEWKVNKPELCCVDVDWLNHFCAAYPDTLGISICAMTIGSRRCEIVHSTSVASNSLPNSATQVQFTGDVRSSSSV